MSKHKAIILILLTAVMIAASQAASWVSAASSPSYLIAHPERIRADESVDLPETSQGIAVFEARVKKNPRDALSLHILAQLYLKRGRERGDVGSYQQAETAASQAIAELPQFAAARLTLATIYYGQHRFDEALALAETLYQENPKRTAALSVSGDAYLALGDHERAQAAYTRLYEKDAVPGVLARMAYLEELHGRPDEALAMLETAASSVFDAGIRGEELAWYLQRLGDVHYHQGQLEPADAYYQAALRVFEEYYPALAGLGRIRAAQGRMDEAVRYLQDAVDVLPQPETLAALGDVYHVLGDEQLAQQQYETVEYIARLAEINQQVYNRQLVYFYADHNLRIDKAVQLASAELGQRKDIYGYDAAAWAEYKNGAYSEAARLIAKAMRYGTRDARLFYHAGMIAYALGERTQSISMLETALEINPYFSLLQSKIARGTLQQLKTAQSMEVQP